MCFSAPASFSASIVLVVLGTYAVVEAKKRNKFYLGFALLPLLFGIQQFFEGVVWLSIKNDHPMITNFFSYGFLFFAWLFWPFWSNFMVYLLHSSPEYKNNNYLGVLKILMLLSLVVGLIIYIPVFVYPDLFTVVISYSSISYDAKELFPANLLRIMYCLLAFLPVFLSKERKIIFFGILLLCAVVISYLLYSYAFTSVWCFFAAILSIYLIYVVRTAKKLEK